MTDVTIPLTVVTTNVNIPFVVARPNDQRDINYWLTDAQIADAASISPSIDFGPIINRVLAYLYAKYNGGTISPNNNTASASCFLRLHNTYLHSVGIQMYPGQTLLGDNNVDTRLIRIDGGDGDGITVLARNGSSNNALARFAIIKDICLLSQASRFNSDGTPQNAISAEPAFNDPHYAGSSSYNSYVCESVRVISYSGHGFTGHQSRERYKLRHCFVTGCGTQLAALQGADYCDGYHFGDSADIEMLACAGGGNGGHSIYINGADTPQITGGDFWPSKNPQLNKRAIYITNSLHFIVDGPDVNGVVEYDGPTINNQTVMIKGRWTNINFRFREVSFGEGSDGTPYPQPAYIITKNAHGILSTGNTFEPSLDNSGVADRWTDHIYQILGNASMYCMDHLPGFADPLYPAGKSSPTDVATQDSICNDLTKLTGVWPQEDTSLGVVRTLFSYGAFMSGFGMIGARDGSAPAAGCWGEYLNQKVPQSASIGVPGGSPLNITTLALGAGDFDIEANLQFTGNNATGSLLAAALSNDSGGNQNQMMPVTPGSYAAFGLPFSAVTGPLVSLHLHNRMNTAGTMTNRLGTVATAQSLNVQVTGTGISVFGEVCATRRAH